MARVKQEDRIVALEKSMAVLVSGMEALLKGKIPTTGFIPAPEETKEPVSPGDALDRLLTKAQNTGKKPAAEPTVVTPRMTYALKTGSWKAAKALENAAREAVAAGDTERARKCAALREEVVRFDFRTAKITPQQASEAIKASITGDWKPILAIVRGK